MNTQKTWYQIPSHTCLQTFQTNESTGLLRAQIESARKRYSTNELDPPPKESLLHCFFRQLQDFMIYTLLAAALVSFATSWLEGTINFTEPCIILAIVLINAILGVYQEQKAKHSLESLQKYTAPLATVLRDGKKQKIPAIDLVPGDYIFIETGDSISADIRLLHTSSLSLEESTLTGESEPVHKSPDTITKGNVPLAEQHNMAFSGTLVASGHGSGIVVATGMNTELGKIAHSINQEPLRDTPLQRKLNHTGKILGFAALGICIFLFLLGLAKKQAILPMFMTSVSLGVAAIPESLPALVTIMLSLGVQRMAKKNAIIRHLPAVETLGGATVICSDKTGTLTLNQMAVSRTYTRASDTKLFQYFTLCSRGNTPMEQAIFNQANKLGIHPKHILDKYPVISEIPFDSKNKYMTTFHQTPSGILVITKGAPELILAQCDKIQIDADSHALTDSKRREIQSRITDYSLDALRTLALCYTYLPKGTTCQAPKHGMVFMGLAGFMDPPRPEVAQAVRRCKQAGIRPIMITGDHPNTAQAIALKLGIAKIGETPMTGQEFQQLSPSQQRLAAAKCSVFARVSPSHKNEFVKALQEQGEIVAMTGDGVNDAPALRGADIGCSMGKCGTDTAKNASDMILLDDNFATIVDAIEEGRGIYQNIKKAVHFLLSCNIGEIMTILVAILLGKNSPLSPVQLLFINLVTDSFPAICLGLEPPEKGIMKQAPIPPSKGLFSFFGGVQIALEGMLIGSLALVAYALGGTYAGSTMCFAVLSFSQLFHTFNMKSRHSLLSTGIWNNKKLLFSVFFCILLQLSTLIFPLLQNMFHTVPLTRFQWFLVFILSLLPIPLVELEKYSRNHN